MKFLRKLGYAPPHPSVLTERQKMEHGRLRRGLEEGSCLFLTVSWQFTSPIFCVCRPATVSPREWREIRQQYSHDVRDNLRLIKQLRQDIRHRIQDDYPGARVWTVLEHTDGAGWHLHIVVRARRRELRTMAQQYMEGHIERWAPGFRCYVEQWRRRRRAATTLRLTSRSRPMM